MQFLVSALGSAGDVHPFIAISQALQARGHAVRILSAPHFAERIGRAGIDFTPLGQPGEYEELLQRRELWQPLAGTRFVLDELLRRLPEGYAIVDELARAPQTVLVGSTLAWANRLVQERRGIPAATVHLAPICLQSATQPSVLPGIGDLSWMPPKLLRFVERVSERLLLDRWIGPRLNRVRAAIGLPPVRQIVSRWMHSPDLVVAAWPEWFATTQPDWLPQVRTSGFPLFDEPGPGLDDRLSAFLAAGTPPIGITAGSAMAHGDRLFAGALAACRALDRRAVLITPFADQLPPVMPTWARHVAYAPFTALVPRLSALVHHGGIGTSAQALAAGIPQVVVPFAHDQFDNAARLRRLGVAAQIEVTASETRWTATIARLMESQAVAEAARRNAVRMAADAPAADRIAERLEQLDRSPRSASQRTMA